MKLIHADCLEAMKKMPDNSVDAVVTDPPYGLSFMGKKWDYDVPSVEVWCECLRVLKPGGHLLAFAGSRTYHRLVVNVEDAGFEIRDQIMWVYGSGFPKSHNISKAIDKAAGAEREVVGIKSHPRYLLPRTNSPNHMDRERGIDGGHGIDRPAAQITAPATPEAQQWDGGGTALKPAHEPIVVARKPLAGTVAANVLEHGTGGLNIDGCRVGDTVETWPSSRSYPLRTKHNSGDSYGSRNAKTEKTQEAPAGRFPANFIHDGSDEVTSLFPEEKARFFYCAKAGKAERNAGLEAFEDKKSHHNSGGIGRKVSVEKRLKQGKENAPIMKNIHPTVKPIALMRYLCRLVTPPNGVVLDPFMGSGTTGVGAVAEGFDFIGIEMDEEYLKIADARIKHAQREHKTDYAWL